jgi:hypothetical protein
MMVPTMTFSIIAAMVVCSVSRLMSMAAIGAIASA